jgi:hypothetical protein
VRRFAAAIRKYWKLVSSVLREQYAYQQAVVTTVVQLEIATASFVNSIGSCVVRWRESVRNSRRVLSESASPRKSHRCEALSMAWTKRRTTYP